MKRILLIRPDSELTIVKRLKAFLHLEPLALELLAGVVPVGHQVRILDMTLKKHPMRSLKRLVRDYDPHLVGITAYSNQRNMWKDYA